MTCEMYDRIIDLIPSADLKNAIRDSEYSLTESTLLAISYHCAPDYNTRLDFLNLLEASFTGEIKIYITKIIETQHQMLCAFTKQTDDTVFELHIKETPDSYDETYLCRSYEAALSMIPLFYQEYDSEETPSARYRIVKRRIFSAKKDEAFSEDYIGEASLLANKTLYSVNVDGYCAENCDGICLDCKRFCVRCSEIQFPRFTAHGDLVQYCNYDGSKRFGVVLQWDDSPSGECYIIPLDSERIRYHDFENAHYSHEHIPAHFVEKIYEDILSDEMHKNYYAYLEYLKNNL